MLRRALVIQKVLTIAPVTALCLGTPHVGVAQEPWPLSIETNLGLGAGWTSGEYRDNAEGLIGDLLVGLRLRSAGEGALFAAVSLGVQGTGATTLECLPDSQGGCIQGFPEFTVLSILGGWETRTAFFRLLSGPSVVRAYGDWDARRFAWLTRLDAAVPLLGRISYTASLRGFIVPSYKGDSFQLIALGVGFRIR